MNSTKRAGGILMHITSLPGPYGVGTLGKEAYSFADFLSAAGQKYWQVLPLGPTGFGDSPYQASSAFAGNPYLIDLDMLTEEGLLSPEEIKSFSWGSREDAVDYGALYKGRFSLLYRAYRRGWDRDRDSIAAFEKDNSDWLPDYALFFAAKKYFGDKPWTEWDDAELRLRSSEEVLTKYRFHLKDDIQFCVYMQYQFFKQWKALRAYVRKKNIRIIGDVPIYVPMDSSDVWAESKLFQLDDQCRPTAVAGVPPDYFSADGQLWGNPLYRWDDMAKDGYCWWVRRLQAQAELFDVIRIDHFRGLESYWAVPFGDKTAKNGKWVKGPGKDFIQTLKLQLPEVDIIAEDLGFLTPEVGELLNYSGYPGMKILEFAFDSREPSNYLPHRYGTNCVCYTGTHDNNTLHEWIASADEETLEYACEYLGNVSRERLSESVIRAGMMSTASLFIVQMQDWLKPSEGYRMNEPGRLGGGNWQWRMLPGSITPELTKKIARMTTLYER